MNFLNFLLIMFATFVLLTISIATGVSVGLTVFYEKFHKGK